MKPAGYNSLSPYLISADAEAAIAFMTATFGAQLLRRFDRPDGSLMHAEVRIDDTVVMIGGGATSEQSSSPHLHLYVSDVDIVFAKALKNGATSIQEPTKKHEGDDYRGGVRDPFGTSWWIAKQGEG